MESEVPGISLPVDAILFGAGLSKGGSHTHRINDTLDKLEPILGGKGHIRDIGVGQFLCSKSPLDTLWFPGGHELSGKPRFEWRDGPDGLRLGTLVPEART